ncbi:MAG: RnfABCDGE type electron transport complex subunit D [Oscillospiraceae bacterium]|nr:RnfABCDGE type electron transport complex subunit D [Oscillospiraceae bacterium]MBR3611098.1 RnfABCDGE type electron transport complex subunit D [Oscillospiraceae bacterium]MBR3953074.1 RnfABCDGE type electron transport complex subunit D [Oscillospiraceae bacterium]
MDNNLIVSVSPHVHGKRTTTNVMLDVVIALLPAAIAGVVIFGMNAAILCAVCVASCVLFEFLFTKLCHRPTTIGDLSAVVTGLILAMNLPATLPVWQAVVGSFVAIVITKCLFGGIGCNFANPAITARVVMLIAFTGTMAAAVPPKSAEVDVATYATPLSVLPQGGDAVSAFMESTSLMDMFLGVRGGALGETCAAGLLLGGIYLVVRKVITWHTPVVFIGAVFAFAYLITGDMTLALYYTLSGGTFIGAIFMATDYVTSPSTAKGKIVFALGCAIITTLIRFYGSYPEGVSFSILFMNILNPYIDKWTMKKPFGGVKA